MSTTLSTDAKAFLDKTVEEAALAFRVFRETGTITANGTVGFIERIPGEDKLITINYPGPFNPGKELQPSVNSFDGTVFYGKGAPRPGRKMGHMVAFGATTEEAAARAQGCRAALLARGA